MNEAELMARAVAGIESTAKAVQATAQAISAIAEADRTALWSQVNLVRSETAKLTTAIAVLNERLANNPSSTEVASLDERLKAIERARKYGLDLKGAIVGGSVVAAVTVILEVIFRFSG